MYPGLVNMDPGTGLVVNNWGHSETGAPKTPPKSRLELPHGFLEKPHVRHALKYMADEEQREMALEVALAWKKKFAADEWKPVIAAIETVRKEDSIRSPPDDDDEGQGKAIVSLDEDFVYAAERARAMSIATALAVPQAVPWPGSKRIELLRKRIANLSRPLRRDRAPSSPRLCRWDVLATGPVTPLTPTPLGNSFAGRSTWDLQTPQTDKFQPSTPVIASLLDTDNPFLPYDAEARAAYTVVKDEIDALARKYCMARFNTHTSEESDDFVPHTMIKPKDIKEAAQMALDARKIKLKEAIIKDLPDRLRRRAAEKSVLISRLCITNESELREQYDWMNNEALMPIPNIHDKSEYELPPTNLVLSILDEQREVLRMFRKQPESGDLELSKMAVEAAWTVQILEEAERLVAAEPHSWSGGVDDDDDDDHDGYSYSNFLRSIKSEMSTSSSSGALSSMVDEVSSFDLASTRLRSNTTQTVDSRRTRGSRFPRSSTRTSVTADSRPPVRLSDSSSGSSHKHRSSSYRRPDLRIVTETIDETSSSELTPEDREFRHRGPNQVDLDYWAAEIRKMENIRAERQRSATLHRFPPRRIKELSGPVYQRIPTKQANVGSRDTGAFSTGHLHSRFSSSSSSGASSLVRTPPRPSHAAPTPSIISSTSTIENRPTMLDHEYHQRNLGKAPIKTHRRETSHTSMHDATRRTQHIRSASALSILVKKTTKEEEEDWMGELHRMETRERARQAEERWKATKPWDGENDYA